MRPEKLMTEKIQNPELDSFLNSENAAYLEHLQKKYSADKTNLEASWQTYFLGIESSVTTNSNSAISPSWVRKD
jgi:2-oxoglutarate dehydrogenase complex dehydrogenase (E1) component-like enzyme